MGTGASDYAGWEFARCRRCTVLRTLKRADVVWEYSGEYHRREYWQRPDDKAFFADGIPQNRVWLHRDRATILRTTLEDSIQDCLVQPRVLQIGPGIGPACYVVGHYTAQQFCVEIGDWPARFIRETYPGVEVHQGDFMADLPADWPAEFDVVMSNHCLEHVERADEAFAKMAGLLAPGGRLWCEVPAPLLPDGSVNEAVRGGVDIQQPDQS